MHTTTAFHVSKRFAFHDAGERITVAKFGLQKVNGALVRTTRMLGQFAVEDGRQFTRDNGEAFDDHDPCDRSDRVSMLLAVAQWRKLPR